MRTSLLTLFALLVAWPGAARAIPLGSIFSGPTTADPLTVYYNPAAMTLLEGTEGMILGGASFIRAHYDRTIAQRDGTLRRSGATVNLGAPSPKLAFGLVTDAGLKNLRFGIGFTLPVVDGARWETTAGGKPSPTRYYASDASQAHFYIEAAVAYRINRFISIGVGLDVIGVRLMQIAAIDYGAKVNGLTCEALKVEATQCPVDAPLPREDPTYDGELDMSGTGWSAGVYGGVMVTPLPWLRISAAIHSGGFDVGVPVSMTVGLPESVRRYVAANLPAVKLPELQADGEVIAHSPMTIIAGVAVNPIEKLEVSADVYWVNKSEMSLTLGNIHRSTSTLIGDQVLVKALSDDWLFGLRGVYEVIDGLRVALRLEFDPTTRSERFVSPVTIDLNKLAIELGVTWRVAKRVTIGVEYSRYFIFDVVVQKSNFGPNANPTTPEEEGLDKPSPTGTYSAETDRLAASLRLHF